MGYSVFTMGWVLTAIEVVNSAALAGRGLERFVIGVVGGFCIFKG